MTNVFKQNPVLLFSEEWSFIMDDTALKVAGTGICDYRGICEMCRPFDYYFRFNRMPFKFINL